MRSQPTSLNSQSQNNKTLWERFSDLLFLNEDAYRSPRQRINLSMIKEDERKDFLRREWLDSDVRYFFMISKKTWGKIYIVSQLERSESHFYGHFVCFALWQAVKKEALRANYESRPMPIHEWIPGACRVIKSPLEPRKVKKRKKRFNTL